MRRPLTLRQSAGKTRDKKNMNMRKELDVPKLEKKMIMKKRAIR